MISLAEKTALITGAAGHLGVAMVEGMIEYGATVYVAGRKQKTLDALAARLGNRAKPLVLDVTDAASISRAVAQLPALDVLVHNAYAGAQAEDLHGKYQDAYAIAVTAAAALTEAALPLLERSGRASVLAISSMYGMVSPQPALYTDHPRLHNPPFYGSAKAALIQWVRYMAVHLAPRGIRVNAISPGPFPSRAIQQSAAGFIDALATRSPLGRIGQPHELSGAAVFLASDAASYITGINLPVDGGWTVW